MTLDILNASPSVGAWKCEPMTVAEIDAHPDRDRIWATIKAMQEGHDQEIETAVSKEKNRGDDAARDAEDDGYDRGRESALGDVRDRMDEWMRVLRKELDGLK